MVPASALLALVLLQSTPGALADRAAGDPPLLVVLSDTGRKMDGHAVVERVQAAASYTVLTSGYSGRVLRLYRMAQRFSHPRRPPQPAYLVLSDNQGGFPRVGFVLDGQVQADTTFVDLHRRSTLTGQPGAMDQIFPHELMHIVVADLAGQTPEGPASQVHAVGVRTDRMTAFNEGFAEHAQLMAIDDPGARPETRAIAENVAERDRVYGQFEAYRRAVAARWAVAPKARMTFPLWFSRAEQVLRYHAVKANLFAREPEVPARLLTPGGAYRAYLLENVLPGRADAPPKPAARLLATEGVVSALFYRLVNTPAIRNGVDDDAFYGRFGVVRDEVDSIDNAYLKIFSAIREGRYDAAAVIDAYARLFPGEAAAAREVLDHALVGQSVPFAPQIWLLNEQFTAGTTVFDQYQGLPLVQTFDLNAASPADLAGVPHLDRALADAILRGGPYTSLDDLHRVPGMTAAVLAAFHAMRRAIAAPPAPGTSVEGSLSIKAILAPYGWRALKVWLAGAFVAAILYGARCPRRWWRVGLNGLAAMLIGLLAGWTIDSGNGVLALATPVVLCGAPAAFFEMWRSRSVRDAGVVLAAWTLAALPAAVVVAPLG